MTVYIDPPTWPGHGRMWSHLVSDTSYEELHAFADTIGAPRRAFDGDHYDLPSERYASAVAAGAVEVGSKELLRHLTAAGLRRPKRRSPQGQASSPKELPRPPLESAPRCGAPQGGESAS